MADSGVDMTLRTLIKKIVAVDGNSSVVRPNARRRKSQVLNKSTQRRLTTEEVGSPTMILRSRMKEKLRRSGKMTSSTMNTLPPRRVSVRRGAKVRLLNLDDTDTPRTILKNIIRTAVHEVPLKQTSKEGAKGPQSEPRLDMTQDSTEPSLTEFAIGPNITRQRRKKPLSLAQFQKGVDERLQQYQALNRSKQEETIKSTSAMDNLSDLTRSLQSVPEASVEAVSVEKKGLVRRPKKRRMINMEDFEQRVEQNLQLLKGWYRGFNLVTKVLSSFDWIETAGSQECYIEPSLNSNYGSVAGTSLSHNNTDIILSNTALYAKFPPVEWHSQGCSPSKPLKSRPTSLYMEEIRHARISSLDKRKSRLSSGILTAAVSGVDNERDEVNDFSMEEGLQMQVHSNDGGTCDVSMEEEEMQVDIKEDAVSKTALMEDVDFERIDGVACSIKERKILSSTKIHEYSPDAVRFGKSLMQAEDLVDSVSLISSPTPIDLSMCSGFVSAPPIEWPTSKQGHQSAVGTLEEVERRSEIEQRSKRYLSEEEEQAMYARRSVHKGSLISSPTPDGLSRCSGFTSTTPIEWTASKQGHRSVGSALGEVKRRSEIEQSSKRSTSENEEQAMNAGGSVSKGSRISSPTIPLTPSNLSRRSGARTSQLAKLPATNGNNWISTGSLGKGERREQSVHSGDVSEDEEVEQLMNIRRPVSKGSRLSSPAVPSLSTNLSRQSGALSSQLPTTNERHEISAGERGKIERQAQSVQSSDVSEDEEQQMINAARSVHKGSRISSPAVPALSTNLSRQSGALSTRLPTANEWHEISVGEHGKIERRAQTVQSSNVSEDEEEEQMITSVHKVISWSKCSSSVSMSAEEGNGPAAHAPSPYKGGASMGQGDIMQDEDEGQSTDAEDTESEELSIQKDNFLPAKTKNGVRLSTPLPTPQYLKKLPQKLPVAKHAPKNTHRAVRKKELGIPRSLVKQAFAHYTNMKVDADSYSVVQQSVNVYFKQLSDDLAAFAGHAGRKTVEAADVELLMRRQGLVTDKMPLNVLIERHLPLEYRRLLIPVATSGNRILFN